MGFEYQGRARCNRAAYWGQFAINVVAIFGLLGYSIYSLLTFAIGTALLCFALVIPVGIYFRVVMMRRCRDIGWPPALPWIFFGAGILVNLLGLASGPGHLALTGLVGLADFAFMVVIGCIPSQYSGGEDYAAAFRGGPELDYDAHRRNPVPASRGFEPAPAQPIYRSSVPPAETEQEARWDAAIAAALSAREQGGGAEPAPATRQQPHYGAPARIGGFGRKVV